ncbi:DNA repair protein XRCC3 [Gadus chalcogrammus]|uniref:DNA repair protein XRCC3 n=1 Tax=Gadus chalcogrammus TaxID=1042646 RepID=UPI0024C4B21C|nr:DNA repair protein XRCC3 [Gadus chalcogrammus]
MSIEQLELNPRIIKAVNNANIGVARDILKFSGPDLQRLTRLSASDVHHLQTAVAALFCQKTPVSALQLYRGECPEWDCGLRVSLGCPVLDGVLRGGLLPWGLTELAGPSGAGKSQLAMQLCLSVQYPVQYGGLGSGALYICTEDSFPIRRLKQLQNEQPSLRSDVPPDVVSSICFSDNIYVEHAADLGALMACVSQRVPVLLAQGRVRLLVVDSVAALFRSEFQADQGLERSRHLTAFATALHKLSASYQLPILCVNQVTDVMEGDSNHDAGLRPVDSKVVPALGMAWANQVMVRLMVTRLPGAVSMGTQSSACRRLEVVFAPHLARDSCLFGVWREGTRGLPSPPTQDASS